MPNSPEQHYKTLGLKLNATQNEIKTAYRALAKEFHPDKNPAPFAHFRFRKIQAAYEELTKERTSEELLDEKLKNYKRRKKKPTKPPPTTIHHIMPEIKKKKKPALSLEARRLRNYKLGEARKRIRQARKAK